MLMYFMIMEEQEKQEKENKERAEDGEYKVNSNNYLAAELRTNNQK